MKTCALLAVAVFVSLAAIGSVEGCKKAGEKIKEFFVGKPKQEFIIQHKGCYLYPSTNTDVEKSENMRTDICNSKCWQEGFKFMALRGQACMCETFLSDQEKKQDEDCKLPCPGEPTELCGGEQDNYYSAYATGEKKL